MQEPPDGEARTPSALVNVLPVPDADHDAVLRDLFVMFPADERDERLAAVKQSVAQGSLSLAGLRQACRDGVRVGVLLSMAQPDRITLVWPPVMLPEVGGRDEIFAALMDDLRARVDVDGTRIAQVLLEPHETELAARFEQAGFRWRTELFFLARTLQELPEVPASAATWRPFTEERAAEFASLLERTYQGSLDCPWLEGLRSGAEALASHRLAGRFDPTLWGIYELDGQAAGLCLLNDHADQDALELVYFGVAPEFRGRGLGRRMIVEALHRAAARGRVALFLAVDAQNTYANAVYADLGFAELARRVARFRPCGPLARDSSTGS